MGFVPMGHRPIKSRHFYLAGDNDAFKPANLVFQAMLVKLKQEGKGVSIHKPPIEVDDIAIIYKSFNLDVCTDLKNKLFVDFMLFYCNRCRENLRELKKTDFSFHGSGDNKYIALRDHSTKNHCGDSNRTLELFPVPWEKYSGLLPGYTLNNCILCKMTMSSCFNY